jgi:hypothetical protein
MRLHLASSPDVATATGEYFYKCLPTAVVAGTRRPICFVAVERSAQLAGMKENGAPPPLGLLPLALSQSKSRATTIFVNELDAGSFKRPLNDLKGCATRLARAGF